MASISTAKPERSIQTFLENHPSVEFIRLQWVDFSGILRTRFVPKEQCLQMIGGDHYKLAQNCMIMPVSTPYPGFPQDPQVWELHPDWDSLKFCAFAPKHAAVMCCVHQRGAPKEFDMCPRSLLQDVVKRFEDMQDTKVLVGFEVEFALLDESLNLVKPLDRIAGYSMTAGLRGETLSMIEEVVHALKLAGIAVYHFHSETPDQLEIALTPMRPVEAVDALMFALETIKTVSIRRGIKATMSPRPVFGGPENGCHVHLSLNPARTGDSFIAGILHELKALCAFGMPSLDSYVRVHFEGAGSWVGWGTENRDLPIRKIDDHHWELRFVDFTANLYLFLAVVLEAGSQGIQEKQPLTWKDCTVRPDGLDTQKLATYGITEPLPQSLQASLDAARESENIRRWIGDRMLNLYVAVKQKEIEAFAKMTDEERRQRYLIYF